MPASPFSCQSKLSDRRYPIMKYAIFLIGLFTFSINSVASQNMNYELVDKILIAECDSVSGGNGGWSLIYKGRSMLLIADESHNRMRIISPIVSRDELQDEFLGDFDAYLEYEKAIDAGRVKVLNK